MSLDFSYISRCPSGRSDLVVQTKGQKGACEDAWDRCIMEMVICGGSQEKTIDLLPLSACGIIGTFILNSCFCIGVTF